MTKVLIGNIQGPPGNEGPTGLPDRQEVEITTSSLAAGFRYTSTVDMATAYRLLSIEVSGPSRVRLYVTIPQRDADASRPLGADPVGNHGIISDLAFDGAWDPADVWDLSPQADGYLHEGIAVPIHIDNLGLVSAIITVKLTFIRTE